MPGTDPGLLQTSRALLRINALTVTNPPALPAVQVMNSGLFLDWEPGVEFEAFKTLLDAGAIRIRARPDSAGPHDQFMEYLKRGVFLDSWPELDTRDAMLTAHGRLVAKRPVGIDSVDERYIRLVEICDALSHHKNPPALPYPTYHDAFVRQVARYKNDTAADTHLVAILSDCIQYGHHLNRSKLYKFIASLQTPESHRNDAKGFADGFHNHLVAESVELPFHFVEQTGLPPFPGSDIGSASTIHALEKDELTAEDVADMESLDYSWSEVAAIFEKLSGIRSPRHRQNKANDELEKAFANRKAVRFELTSAGTKGMVPVIFKQAGPYAPALINSVFGLHVGAAFGGKFGELLAGITAGAVVFAVGRATESSIRTKRLKRAKEALKGWGPRLG